MERCDKCGARTVDGETIYTAAEIAALFGVTRRTISDWVKNGWLVNINRPGHIRVPASSLEKMLVKEA